MKKHTVWRGARRAAGKNRRAAAGAMKKTLVGAAPAGLFGFARRRVHGVRWIPAVALLLLFGFACTGDAPRWGYTGDIGPQHWAELSPQYRACAGKNQAPINLTGFTEADLQPIRFDYRAGGNEILNNGHTVQVQYAADSSIVVDGRTFALKQFHFHAPSENHINGQSFPMEAHLVHADKDGHLAVIAVMFTHGEANKGLAAAWAKMPQHAGDKHALPSPVAAADILPANRDHYRFNGSLTTPPCTEGVRWLVMKEPVPASVEQIERFARVMHHPNNRPIQETNARAVLR